MIQTKKNSYYFKCKKIVKVQRLLVCNKHNHTIHIL